MEEKKNIDKKKMVTYVAVLLSFTLGILFFMAVYDGFFRKPEVKEELQQTQVENKTLVENNSFKQLFSQQAQNENKDNPSQETEENSAYNNLVDDIENDNPTRSTLKDDPITEIKNQFLAQEVRRALLAAHASFSSREEKKVQYSKPQSFESSIAATQSQSDLERNQVAERIESLARVQEEFRQNSDHGPIDEENFLTKIAEFSEGFSTPPSEIAGYTKENIYNSSTVGKFKLPVGTIIPAITSMKTISDYAGVLKGIVTQDIYNINYSYVLIPKGSEVIMKSVRISNVNEPIQARMGLTVQWIVLPNGNKIDMSKSSGLDREGVAALKDQVNYHFLAQFLGVAAYAVLANETSYKGTGTNQDKSFQGNLGGSLRGQFLPLAQKYLSLVPTVTIRAGQSLNIILETEIFLDPWENIYDDYR